MPNFYQFLLFLFIIQFSSIIPMINCSPILETKSEHLNAIKNDLIQTMYGGKNPFRGHLNQPCKTNTNCGLLEYCSSGRCACAFSFKEITVSSIQRCSRFECTENGECLQEFGENAECGQENFCTCIQPYRINLFTQNCSVKIDADSPEVAKIRAYGTIFVKPECSEDSDCFVKYGDKQLTCEHYSRQCIKYASLSPEFKEMFNLYTNLTLDNQDPQNATKSIPIDPKDSSNKTRKRSYLFSYLTFIPILIIGMICYYFFLEESTHRVRIVRNLRREAVANGEGFLPTSEEIRSMNLRSALLNSLMSRHMAAQGIGSSSASSHHFRDDPISVIIFNAHDSSLNAVFDREFNNWSSNSSTNRQEEERSSLLGKDLPPSYDEVVHIVAPLATPEDIHQDIQQETHQAIHQETHQETNQATHQATHQLEETHSTSHEPYHDPVQPPPYDSLRHSSENLNDI